jgi:hypothetical protein
MPRLPMREDLDRMAAATLEARRLKSGRRPATGRSGLFEQVRTLLPGGYPSGQAEMDERKRE